MFTQKMDVYLRNMYMFIGYYVSVLNFQFGSCICLLFMSIHYTFKFQTDIFLMHIILCKYSLPMCSVPMDLFVFP